MKITAQEEYGLRCVLQIARSDKRGEPVPVSLIAKREGLSTDYVTKLLVLLRKAGLVDSVRGTNGGYALKKNSKDITLSDIIIALEGSFVEGEICNKFPGNEQECVHLTGCSIRPVWASLARYLYDIFSQTTLADLLEEESSVLREIEGKVQQLTAPVTSVIKHIV